jgi:translocation and assembly module TamA
MPAWCRPGVVAGALALAAGVAMADTVRVEVEGLDKEVRNNTLALLGIAREQENTGLSADRIRLLHRKAEAEIRASLEPFGYYRPVVNASLANDGASWTARYAVEPGPPMLINSLELAVTGEGASDPSFIAFRAKPPLSAGGALVHARYEDAKRQLSRLAAARGYFDARLTRSEIRVDVERYPSEVFLDFDTGPRYRFGPVEVQVTGDLNADWLSRYAEFEKGEPFDAEKITDLQKALLGTDYFSTVDIRPAPARASDGQVPIEVLLVQRKRDQYTAGLGYGTDTGVRGTLGWERRFIGERGQKFNSELEVSEILTGLSAQYTIPVFRPVTDKVALTANASHDHPETSDSRTVKTGASLTRGFGDWLLTGSLVLQRERFEVADDSGDTKLLMPGASALYVRADDRIIARRGYRVQLDLRGASDSVVSDLTFVQGRIQGKGILGLGESGRLITRAEAGATNTDDFDELPATLRFYAGGDNSVRGYAYESIGPVNASGEVTGGKYLLTASIEYEHHLYKKWSGVTFYDAGNAFLGEYEPLKSGVGVGVRWRSPVGNIRLDIANAVSEPDRPWRIHFTLGPDF